MEAFFISTLAVTIGEIGDKTQLLALLLAARYRQPMMIIFGVTLATLLNHSMAGALGGWISTHIDKTTLQWAVGILFIAIALWALKADKIEDKPSTAGKYGAFVASFIAFFLAEMGDKTQLATIGLAIKYEPLYAVIIGTTLGMLVVNIPTVLLGAKLAEKLPLKACRYAAAAIFAVIGIATIGALLMGY